MTRVKIISGEDLKTGDTEPDLEVQLIQDSGVPKDLSTGSPEVNFHIRAAGSDTLSVDDDTAGNVTITDAANGKVEYSWQSGDTDTAATYEGEVEIVDGTDTSTYPSDRNFKVYVREGIN